MSYSIAWLAGDGVGPEVAAAAASALKRAGELYSIEFDIQPHLFGGAAIDKAGEPLPNTTLDACRSADAVFLGAIGGPKWDRGGPRPEAGLLALRKALGVYANLRPIKIIPGMENLSPLKLERAAAVDMLIVRELTGGLYFGAREEGDARASDSCVYSREEVQRVARIAFEAARKRRGRVASVDKANVMATSRLWRAAIIALHEAEFPDIELEHILVDAMAMKLIQQPSRFDVIVTENLFGDILSDEASVIAGSIGLAPSASLGDGARGLYEPIHGSAPDIAGADKANPAGAILSAAMMLRHSFGEEKAAQSIEAAVETVIRAGGGTGDIGGTETCSGFGRSVCDAIK